MRYKQATSFNSLLIILLLFNWSNLHTQTINPDFIDGIVYVKVADTSSMELAPYNFSDPILNGLYTTYEIDTITKPFQGLTTQLDKTYRITFQQIAQIDNLISNLQLLPYIEYAEKAPLYKSTLVPDDIQPEQWALNKINAKQAWDITTGSGNITIAIVDNAVSTTHEDLTDNIWINPGEIPNNLIDDDLNGYVDDINGWDVADNDNNPNPPSGITTGSPFIHGTHCAGIASATTNNNKGIASIGFNTRIIAVKCSNDNSADEGNSLPNAYDGVYYAIKANADIISMSWGGSSGVFLTGDAIINAANTLGIVLIAAAGNDNSTTSNYPAAYNNVISVGSTDQSDLKSSFSNYGSSIDVMAPGSSIYSTLPSNSNNAYGYLSGTSMACPLVAGLAALILSENPSLTPAQIENHLKNGCDNINALNPSYTNQLGAGRINAFKSLQFISGIESSELNNESVLVFPNPSHGKLTLLSTNKNVSSISILDLNGRVIYFKDGILSSNIIVNLVPGSYTIKLTAQQSVFFKKVIVI